MWDSLFTCAKVNLLGFRVDINSRAFKNMPMIVYLERIGFCINRSKASVLVILLLNTVSTRLETATRRMLQTV